MVQSPSFQSRHSPHLMEPKASLPHSQASATCPYPEPQQSSPYSPHPTSWRSLLITSSHLRIDHLNACKKVGSKMLWEKCLLNYSCKFAVDLTWHVVNAFQMYRTSMSPCLKAISISTCKSYVAHLKRCCPVQVQLFMCEYLINHEP